MYNLFDVTNNWIDICDEFDENVITVDLIVIVIHVNPDNVKNVIENVIEIVIKIDLKNDAKFDVSSFDIIDFVIVT